MSETIALTIAGSDPSGGAGLQADLKTFHQFGVYGMSAVTLLTVQNTQTVQTVQVLDADFVVAQINAVVEDIPPQAAKTGALGSVEIIEAVAERASRFSFPLVVDPVMISKHGSPLIAPEAVELLKKKLLPKAFLTTPNVHEAKMLAGMEVIDSRSMEAAARAIADLGPKSVLIKGGKNMENALDVLYHEGEIHTFSATVIETNNTHGTGCTYSAAITAALAKGGDLITAIERAKRYITAAIQTNPELGKGVGPVNFQAVVE